MITLNLTHRVAKTSMGEVPVHTSEYSRIVNDIRFEVVVEDKQYYFERIGMIQHEGTLKYYFNFYTITNGELAEPDYVDGKAFIEYDNYEETFLLFDTSFDLYLYLMEEHEYGNWVDAFTYLDDYENNLKEKSN